MPLLKLDSLILVNQGPAQYHACTEAFHLTCSSCDFSLSAAYCLSSSSRPSDFEELSPGKEAHGIGIFYSALKNIAASLLRCPVQCPSVDKQQPYMKSRMTVDGGDMPVRRCARHVAVTCHSFRKRLSRAVSGTPLLPGFGRRWQCSAIAGHFRVRFLRDLGRGVVG